MKQVLYGVIISQSTPRAVVAVEPRCDPYQHPAVAVGGSVERAASLYLPKALDPTTGSACLKLVHSGRHS